MDSGSRVGLQIVLGDEKGLGDVQVLSDNKVPGGDDKVPGGDDKVLGDDDKILRALGILSDDLQAPHSAVPATGETVQLGALPPDALAPTTDDDDSKCLFFPVGLRTLRDSPDAPLKEEDPQQTEEDALLAERMRRSPFINWKAVAKREKERAKEEAMQKAKLDKWNAMSELEKQEEEEKEKEKKEMELAALQARLDKDFEEGEGKTRWCMGA